MRIGTGWDIHKLEEGRNLILGGVIIKNDKGCVAHSDGDALCHAIIDAILGAAGLEDIGTLFPESNSEYKDICSLTLLSITNNILKEKKYRIVNIDSTIILQSPKLSSYKDKMRLKLANCLGLDISCINVKAKTAEHLLLQLGSSDAVMAQAVVLLEDL